MKSFFKYFLFLSLAAVLLMTAGCSIGENQSTDGIAINSKVLKDETRTSDGEGTSYGFYYSIWHQNGGSVNFKTFSAAPGKYDFTWTNTETVAGLGWNDWSTAYRNPNHTISYSVELYQNNGSGGLSLYGWTRNPLIEYYITEKGNFDGQNINTITSDGNTYQVRKNQRIQQPSIDGTQTFWQFIDIKQSQPTSITGTSGTITIKNHFDNWAANGLTLGNQPYYQIMAAEGFGAGGSGHAIVTVREGSGSTTKTWKTLGSGTNDNVNALVCNGSTLYVGGSFTSAGGYAARNIAKYSGTSWSTVGSGSEFTDYYIDTLGYNPNTNALFAGGGFTTPAPNFARFKNNGWDGYNGGANNTVYSLVYGSNKLYLGGAFTNVGGVAVNYVAVWDGTNWNTVGNIGSSVPSGSVMDKVRALAIDSSGVLYAAWDYYTYSGRGAIFTYKISKWANNAWTVISTPDAFVQTLVCSGTTLYAGGGFMTTPAVKYIAKYNGSTWSPLGSGADCQIESLASSGSTVYAGGWSKVFMWNGSTLSALGSGFNSWVYALAVDSSGNLYAGGSFTSPGNYIAVYK